MKRPIHNSSHFRLKVTGNLRLQFDRWMRKNWALIIRICMQVTEDAAFDSKGTVRKFIPFDTSVLSLGTLYFVM